MFHKKIANFIFSLGLLFTIVLSAFSVSRAQGNESVDTELMGMIFLSVLLIAAGFFTRRYLLRN
jgi:hypothetical protein